MNGTEDGLRVFRSVLDRIREVGKQLKAELGLVEAQVKIPAIFLKRVLGLGGHTNRAALEMRCGVVITQLNRKFWTDECYELH